MSKRLPEVLIGAGVAKKVKIAGIVLNEASMGITQYASDNTYFNGIIKHRFNDFHVHELSQNSIVYLKSLKVVKEIEVVEEKEDYSLCSIEEKVKVVAEIIPGDGDFNLKFLEFVQGEAQSLSTPEISDKLVRTSVHQAVRHTFGDILDTKTDGLKILIIKSKKGSTNRTKGRKSWKELGGDYCHFTLFKENRDTMDAISIIAKLLRVPNKTFSYAGTKDKRAITTQRIAVYRIRAEQLAGLNKRLQNLRVGDFEYLSKGLSLSDSKGNHFTIAMRDVHQKNESRGDTSISLVEKIQSLEVIVQRALKNLEDVGFINYFGMQRFGTRSVSTHTIGIAMLQEQWKEAAELILGKNDTEKPDIQEARDCWSKDHDAAKALRLFPRQCSAERAILGSFESQQNRKAKINKQSKNVSAPEIVDASNPSEAKETKLEYLQALQSIPRNLRLMYVHAYQSRVWNEMVSMRHDLFGLAPVVGDLVRIKNNFGSAVDNTELTSGLDEKQKQILRDDNVKILTEEDLLRYTIYDVLLPLPGYSMLYPSHQICDSYKVYMAQDGLDPLKMSSKIEDINLPGSYRNIMVKPKNVSGRTFSYAESAGNEDEIQNFITSDLDKIKDSSERSITDGDRIGVVVEFSLGSSQYATMALREITKAETSASFQSQMSQCVRNS